MGSEVGSSRSAKNSLKSFAARAVGGSAGAGGGRATLEGEEGLGIPNAANGSGFEGGGSGFFALGRTAPNVANGSGARRTFAT